MCVYPCVVLVIALREWLHFHLFRGAACDAVNFSLQAHVIDCHIGTNDEKNDCKRKMVGCVFTCLGCVKPSLSVKCEAPTLTQSHYRCNATLFPSLE